MSLKLPSKRTSNNDTLSPEHGSTKRSWLLWLASAWEVFLILLVAGFLRFYQINTTELDLDQAMLFRMAYDAVHHSLLPATSNSASIGISNPPGVTYLLMPVAAFSANPLWGAVLVGAFTTATALLTFFFTRRYYGRFAGIVAALLYATAARPLTYARFIWQPNLMPPFVILFMFALFWGVVDRRKGWLFPALFFFGVLYQMHPTTLLLAVPLLTAIVLAPGTLRWRDLVFACVSLLVIFSPYLIWEMYTGFADIQTFFILANQNAHIDTEAFHIYYNILIPFDALPTDMHSLVRILAPVLSWLSIAVPSLTLCGFAIAGLSVLESSVETTQRSLLTWLRHWWADLRANPYRCGLLLLLVWQIVPLLILSRHAIFLHPQYFFMFLSGPFILIGLFLTKVVEWLRVQQQQWNFLRYAVYGVAGLVIFAQLLDSTAAVIDTSSGNFDDRSFQPYPYHNDLRSLQHALGEADQLAQQRHLNRVYITTDFATETAIRYLAEQMRSPTTLFDATSCLVLPNPTDGPAVLLVGPYDDLTNALLSQYASATLIDQIMRPAGAPFRLYIVSSYPATSPAVQTSPQNAFAGNLQLLGTRAQHIISNNSLWLVTRWNLMHQEQPSFRTTYTYALTMSPNSNSAPGSYSKCTFTAMRAGDQLLVAFDLLDVHAAFIEWRFIEHVPVTIKAQSFTTIPNNPFYGPFHLETDSDQKIAKMILQTTDGRDSITVPVS